MQLVGHIARGDTAVRMLLGYHSLILLSVLAAGLPEQVELLARGSAAGGWYVSLGRRRLGAAGAC
jgi:hypothetical protein